MKTTSTSLVRLCGALLLAVAGSACSGVSSTAAPESAPSAPVGKTPAPAPAPAAAPPPAPVRAAAPAATTDLLQQLRAEIGGAACDTAQQCKTIPVGHKACGGPETYLAWSSKASDGAKLRSLADAYGAKRKSENVASGMISNCMAVMDPGATCNAGRCVTGGAAI